MESSLPNDIYPDISYDIDHNDSDSDILDLTQSCPHDSNDISDPYNNTTTFRDEDSTESDLLKFIRDAGLGDEDLALLNLDVDSLKEQRREIERIEADTSRKRQLDRQLPAIQLDNFNSPYASTASSSVSLPSLNQNFSEFSFNAQPGLFNPRYPYNQNQSGMSRSPRFIHFNHDDPIPSHPPKRFCPDPNNSSKNMFSSNTLPPLQAMCNIMPKPSIPPPRKENPIVPIIDLTEDEPCPGSSSRPGIHFNTNSIGLFTPAHINSLFAQPGSLPNMPLTVEDYEGREHDYEDDYINDYPFDFGEGLLDSLEQEGAFDLTFEHPRRNYKQKMPAYNSSDNESTEIVMDHRLTDEETQRELRELLANACTDEYENIISAEDRTGTPERLSISLMEHQKVGLQWMKKMEASKNQGGILCDDMGLGKTVQAISLIADNPCHDGHDSNSYIFIKKGKEKENAELIKVKGTLVICPVSLITQWEKEILTKTDPPLNVFVYHGVTRTASQAELAKYDVIITSYNVVSGDYPKVPDKKRSLSSLKFHRVILDEAHTIKNQRTRMAEACYLVEATNRWCMTATPIQNSIDELYSLIKFLRIRPYEEIKKFKEEISKPLKRGRHTEALKRVQVLMKAISLRRSKKATIDGRPILNLPERNVHLTHIDFTNDEKEFYDYINSKAQARFNKLVADGTVMQNYSSVLVLLLRLRQACLHPRLTAEDGPNDTETLENALERLASMPPVVINRLLENESRLTEIVCPICIDTAEQARIISSCGHILCLECLNNLLNTKDYGKSKCPECRGNLEKDKVVTVDQFLRTHRPERYENSMGEEVDHVVKQKVQDKMMSSKIVKMIEILKQTKRDTRGKDKTIVFSQFTSMLDTLEEPLEQNNFKFVRYDGGMTVRKRAEVLEKFTEDPKITVLLISTKCGSLGLNLTVANRVILMDIWWNPALENQAIDRVHRIGQTKNVEVHRIFINGTIEDRILQLQRSKQSLVDGALGEGTGQKLGRLGLQEMMYLFRDGRVPHSLEPPVLILPAPSLDPGSSSGSGRASSSTNPQ
ncbi:SNF2 family N-terminal domain-containing protein [Phycomyces nitens]|nr:SNF2 family N-terminal domain-containing protein [Phycomyces nitens]